ncbi:hypothetical protein DFH09DRAFT_1312197 [Mycena vulgaris]|nr:hypothetical protein DFH09DRAFT_1312197 [Mycena vulgaris]
MRSMEAKDGVAEAMWSRVPVRHTNPVVSHANHVPRLHATPRLATAKNRCPSPFTSKLGTNYCPQDEEIIEIQSLLVEPALRLKCLDDEITELQKAVEKLRDERDELGAYVDAHRALISPARRLPLDIIQEIFITCIPTDRNCVMSAIEAPVLLGRICSSWRTISLSTPRLWSSLHIVEPSCPSESALARFEEKLAQRLQTTKTWLSRSGQCPLSISLQSMFNRAGFTPANHGHLLQALVPFASRWEHIHLAVLFSVLAIMSPLKETDVPMLKSVRMTEIGVPVDLAWDSLGFLRGPRIHSFQIWGSSFRPLEIPLRWSGLTDLSMGKIWTPAHSVTSQHVLQMFSRCPQLRTCRLHLDDGFNNNINPRVEEPILELSFLNTLDIQCHETVSPTIHQLFSRSSFPQLRHFSLHKSWDQGPEYDISYAPFLAAAPRIESLYMDIELFSKRSLADFLRALPPTVLELRYWNTGRYIGASEIFDDVFLEALIPSPEVPIPWCPGLQVLEMPFPCRCSDDVLLRFIKSRTLKSVVIQFDREMQLDIRPELQSFVESGLDLQLTYAPPMAVQFSPWEGLQEFFH